MIRILCLNPAIDRMYYIDGFKIGHQHHQTIPQVYPGGKGINVSRVLSLLGNSPILYCFIGGNNGQFIKNNMDGLGIAVKAFDVNGETRSTINIIDCKNRKETEITESGPIVSAEDEKVFLRALESDINPGDLIVCSGVPAAGMSVDIYQRIALIAKQRKARCAIDANKQFLKNSFPAPYYFAKPNGEELASLFGVSVPETIDGVIDLAQKLSCHVENILVTLGREGAIFVGQGKVLKIDVPDEKIISTIGCGDSTVAGFIHALSLGQSVENAIRLSMACGVANGMTGKVGQIDVSLLPSLSAKVRIQAF